MTERPKRLSRRKFIVESGALAVVVGAGAYVAYRLGVPPEPSQPTPEEYIQNDILDNLPEYKSLTLASRAAAIQTNNIVVNRMGKGDLKAYDRNKERVFTILRNQYDYWKAGEALYSLNENELPWSDYVVKLNSMQERLFPEARIWYVVGEKNYAFDNPYGNTSVTEQQFANVLDQNASREKKQHELMWDMVNNPKKYGTYYPRYGRTLGLDEMFVDFISRTDWGNSGKQYKIFAQKFLEGGIADRAPPIIMAYTRYNVPGTHEVYVEATSVNTHMIGGLSYRSNGTIPDRSLGFGDAPDGKTAFPLSDQMKQNIIQLNQSGYDLAIDDATQSMPVIYCIKSPEVKFIDLLRSDGSYVDLYGKSPFTLTSS